MLEEPDSEPPQLNQSIICIIKYLKQPTVKHGSRNFSIIGQMWLILVLL